MLACCKQSAELLEDVYADPKYVARPHRPVLGVFKKNLSSITRLIAQPIQSIPTSKPFGPSPPPPEWGIAQLRADRALRLARNVTLEQADEATTRSHSEWANNLEAEGADPEGEEAFMH